MIINSYIIWVFCLVLKIENYYHQNFNKHQQQNNQTRMSFLNYIDMDPHIHLFALRKMNAQETQDHIKQKIHHLLQTRKFDQLLTQTAKLQGLAFPDLKSKLQQAKKQTQQQKKALGSEDVDTLLNQIDAETQKEDPDYDIVDEGQLKIYRLAKIYYDQGNYQKAYDIMKKLERQQLNQTMDIKTTWARIYCEIVLEDQKIRKTAERLKKKIDDYEKKQRSDRKGKNYNNFNDSVKQSYARRKQFLNLITIAYFLQSKSDSFEKYVQFCNDQENSAVLQLVAPYILRYLSVALILNKTLHKNRKFDLFTLVQALKRKIYRYSDPFIEFLSALYVEFDFSLAKQKIANLRKCIQDDILLKPLENKIIENCYFLFYKVYCKVNERVPLSEIASFTGKTQDEAEMWILGFIRSLDIQAKIDSVDRVVLSSREEESLNEKYIDLIRKMSSFISTLSQAYSQN